MFFIFSIFLLFFIDSYVYPTPEQDKRISRDELEYIETSIFETNSPRSPKFEKIDAEENEIKQNNNNKRDDNDNEIGIEMKEINLVPSTAIVIDSDDEDATAVTPKINKHNNNINKNQNKMMVNNNNNENNESVDHSNEKTGLISAEEKTNTYEKEDKKKRKDKNKNKNKKNDKKKKEKQITRHNSEPIPWCALISNPAAIVIYLLSGAGDWNFYTLMTYAPTFINGMYKTTISTTTLLIFFPFMSETVFQLIICPIGDYLIEHKYLKYKYYYY